MFIAFGLMQQVHLPTRYNYMLNVLATDDLVAVNNLCVDDAGLISDHRLVTASISALLPSLQPMLVEFRYVKDTNTG